MTQTIQTKKKLPKVLIIYTGGTFGMEIQAHSKERTLTIPSFSPSHLKKRFLDFVPELKNLAQCDVDVILNRDSAHIGPSEWILIAQKIKQKWKNYDGIVLLHGTDTLAYTSSALSFLLRPCVVPVVITGAQRPLSALRTDARSNLISAVEIAALGPRKIVQQVTVFFGNKLLQGNRVRKVSASDFNAFDSPSLSPLALVGTTIRYTDHLFAPPTNRLKLLQCFDQKVLLIHITPALPSDLLSQSLLPQLHAMVLVVFHSWTAPTHDPSFIQFLKLAQSQHTPIVLVIQDSSQQPCSTSQLMNYAAGKSLLSNGCFSANSMTPECAYVRTQLLLSQAKDIREFGRFWKQDLAGEGIH